MQSQSKYDQEKMLAILRANAYLNKKESYIEMSGWVGFSLGVLVTSLVFVFILVPIAVNSV